MKKAYVMKTFYGIGEPDLRLIRDKGGKITSDCIQACTYAEYALDFMAKATEALVFEISKKDAAVYEDLDYGESQVVKLIRRDFRILNKEPYFFGRKISHNGRFAVYGTIGSSQEVLGIADKPEIAFLYAWNNSGYEDQYIGSPEQLDRLNRDYATELANVSEEALKRAQDKGDDLDLSDLVFHMTYRDSYEICTKEEYIHVLMTEYDSNFYEWQEG